MRIKLTRILAMVSSLFLIATGCDQKQQPVGSERTFVTIGTGSVTGVYYPTGGAISTIINKKFDTYKIKATVESTKGSVYNINAVLSGDLQFGVVQSDSQYHAFNGEKEWKEKGPQKDLRAVFSVHSESITLIASAASGINGIKDLRGKRVNLGNPGSGQLGNSRDVIQAFGLEESDLKSEYIKAVEAPGLVQDERLDAFFYTVGHPNANIKEATSGKIKVKIVPIQGPELDALNKKYPYYAKSVVPGSMYPNAVNSAVGDIPSFGVKATFVTSAKVSDDIVYAITKEIFDNFEEFKKLHQAFEVLTKENMLQGLSAPIHPGAIKYYKEADLINYVDSSLLPK
ncbi:MAG: TAXI family TRAP transporter solute-binding subunit [SAR324 cluster bacterium]|nr:TAXI family TRAP transporter solute-binding subunit [SAR324 cluster bacterium]